MKFKALEKDLLRYCWMISIITAASVLIFHNTFKIDSNTPVIFALLVGVRFFILGLINIWILKTIPRISPAMPKKKQRLLRYAAGYVLAILLFSSTDPFEQYALPNSGPWTLGARLSSILLQSMINNSLIIIMQNFIILQHEKAGTDLENSRLRAASLESANLLLKQQVHPHFLFNALSMLKSLYKTDVHAGEAYLSHLVSFLRASLADRRSGVSDLADEIKLCKDYLTMQQIRFDKALVCTMGIPEEIQLRGAVPSFSIQSLIENAIKHNEVTAASPLKILVYYRDCRIIVENNLQPRTHIDAPSGKGLINLVERYRILSGDEVIIRQDNNTFSVSIKVLNNEDSNHRR